jgi:4-amino-4-deoxy-L-arabinose transferase-like glycosyltransferase
VSGALLGAVKGGIAGALAGALGKVVSAAVIIFKGRSAENLIDNRNNGEMSAQRRSSRVVLLMHRFWDTLENGRWLPILLFFMTCVSMWFIRGVHHGGDTGRYLGGAENLLLGQALTGKAGAYIGYIVFVGTIKLLGLGEIGIVLAQVVLSAICVFALYDLGRRFAGETCGIAAASLYAVNLDIARFTFAILTDSLYTSGLILSVYLTYRTMHSAKFWAVSAGLIVLLTASIRPGGGLIIPIFAGFILFSIFHKRNSLQRLISFLIVVAVLLPLFLGPMKISYKAENPLEKLTSGYVIYGHDDSRLKMPRGGGVSSEDVESVYEYCIQYPASCLELFLTRIIVFFEHTRPFYSFRHNLLILTAFLPLYALALFGFAYRIKERFTWLVLSLVAFQAVFVGLTFADWDGRFLTYIFPLITLYSAIGIIGLAKRVNPTSARFFDGNS